MKSITIKTTIVLVFSLLFAAQANAYEITTPVDPTGRTWEPSGRWWTTFTPNNVNYYNENRTGQAIFIRKLPLGTTSDGYYILNAVSLGNIPFEYGKYYSVNISFQLQNAKALDMQSMPALNRITAPAGSPYRLMSVTSDWAPCANYHKFTTNTGVENDDFSNYDGMCNWGAVVYNIIVQATDTKTASFQLGETNSDMFRWYMTASSATITNNNQGTIFASTIMEFKKVEQGEALQAQQNEINSGNQAQSDGNQGSNTSQTNTEASTQSLLAAITGFVGIISNATPTNCRITGDMGALDIGQLDFCKDEPPAIIQIIGSLILIAITIPIVIWTIKKIISMFRSFTNG